MIELVDYSEIYDDDIMADNPIFLFEIKYHGDVLKDSICVALYDGKYAGVGFLQAGPTFLCIESRDLPYYHIHMEYKAVSGLDCEIEVTELLLEDLKDSFSDLQANYPGKRLLLRTWNKADSVLSLEFLIAHEFRPMKVTPIMIHNLEDIDYDLPDSTSEYTYTLPPSKKSGEVIIKPIEFTDDMWSQYLEANGDAFVVADSKNELGFKLNDPNTVVFGAFHNGRLVGSVTTWQLSETRATTENIFCVKEYQGLGIASNMIKYVSDYLIKHGYTEASLTVFGENLPALSLYLGLGYEIQNELLEMQYEVGFKPMMY